MVNVLKRNNVIERGQGTQAIMFVHGYGCDQNMWRFVTPPFEKDYRVILLDLVGAGDSDTTAYNRERYSSLQGHADDILEICDALSLQDVIFVGHSVSAMIGVLAAKKNPDLFSRLILVGPSPRYINDRDYKGGFEQSDIEELLEVMDQNYLGWSNYITPLIMANADQPELEQELNQSFCKTNPEIARHFARVTFLSDNRADLASVQTPSLIMQCSEDIIAPDYVGKYMHAHLANSQFVQMNATGHCPHLSAPDETIQTIKSFITQ